MIIQYCTMKLYIIVILLVLYNGYIFSFILRVHVGIECLYASRAVKSHNNG